MTQEPAVRWAGDSPKVDASGKGSNSPIGYFAKDIVKSGRAVICDDQFSLDSPPISTPPALSIFSKEPIGHELPFDSRTPTKAGGSKSMAAGALLQRLKTLVVHQHNNDALVSSSPAIFDGDQCGSFPSTSTPTTASAPILQPNQSEISKFGRRNRGSLKRQRLVLPDYPSEDGKAKVKETPAIDQFDDDSLIASLDLDQFINEARQKRSLMNVGTPFKRFKTTGDLCDSFDRIIAALPPDPAPSTKSIKPMDDDDAFFASEDVLAQVDKVEEFYQTQRTQRIRR